MKTCIGPALRPKLLAFFQESQTKSKLQVEMAATVDWGKPFVKACYHFEGDIPLALDCFETIDQVIASVATENIPNVRAIAQKLTRKPPTHPLHEQWVTYARSCVQDGLDYFNDQLASSLCSIAVGFFRLIESER